MNPLFKMVCLSLYRLTVSKSWTNCHVKRYQLMFVLENCMEHIKLPNFYIYKRKKYTWNKHCWFTCYAKLHFMFYNYKLIFTLIALALENLSLLMPTHWNKLGTSIKSTVIPFHKNLLNLLKKVANNGCLGIVQTYVALSVNSCICTPGTIGRH